ncbi:MAG: STAS domain-containing protein [Planctomycetes bacterium]|nr:STAS domain-containing protein [Planctomycetota bacterium]
MNLPTEVFGDIAVVHAPEEIGRENATQIAEFLLSRDRCRVVVDLDGTESIDGAGLTALLDVQDRLRESGGDLKVITTNLANRKILEITRLDQQLDVFTNVIDAVKTFA